MIDLKALRTEVSALIRKRRTDELIKLAHQVSDILLVLRAVLEHHQLVEVISTKSLSGKKCKRERGRLLRDEKFLANVGIDPVTGETSGTLREIAGKDLTALDLKIIWAEVGALIREGRFDKLTKLACHFSQIFNSLRYIDEYHKLAYIIPAETSKRKRSSQMFQFASQLFLAIKSRLADDGIDPVTGEISSTLWEIEDKPDGNTAFYADLLERNRDPYGFLR
jgi:hypothetical protein